jgi:tetratricopeptide (TPR) repeat protein
MVKKRVIESVVSQDNLTKKWKATFSVARMAYESGDVKQAERLFIQCQELAGQLPEHGFAVPACEIAIGATMLAEGRLKEAESKLAKCVSKLAGAAGEEKELLAVALRFHAEALIGSGDDREAEKQLQESIKICEELGEDGSVQLAYSLCDLCGIYVIRGQMAQAEDRITRAMKLLERALGSAHPEYVRADMIYGTTTPMSEQSRLSTIEDGIQRMQYSYGSKHPNIGRAVGRYLEALESRGDKIRLQEAKDRFACVLK